MELPEEPPPGGSLINLIIEGNISEDFWKIWKIYIFKNPFFSI